MTNMSVPYVRPDNAARTLAAECTARWPGRQADLGYVTGYKSATNFSGHNADANGICHAVDIGTYVDGDINEPDGRALAEQLRQIGAATNRFAYLIHDMSEGAPAPMIAGQFNGWVWQAYGGTDSHSNHIHVSICDLYWGDPAPIPASVYDSTESWGISVTIAGAASTTIEPIQEDPEMTPEQMLELKQFIQNDNEARHLATRAAIAAKELTYGDRVFIQQAIEDKALVTREVIKAAVAAAPGADPAAIEKGVQAALASYTLRLEKAP